MSFITGRALHYVLKIGNRKESIHFFGNVLGMKVLRHEEFTEGCEAQCNGPYDNRWSKTMIGYGPEDDYFALELTYNYGVKTYAMGNDLLGITIRSREALERAKTHNWPVQNGNMLTAPDGYKFYILDEPQPIDTDPIEKIMLASSNLTQSVTYWSAILNYTVFEQSTEKVCIGFSAKQTKLELCDINGKVDRKQAYGRIAFSCLFDEQPLIEKKITETNQKILTPLVLLDTPGKATVRVIILADPDGHEICFVDDESFRQLSKVDPAANQLLDTNIIALSKS